VIGRRVVWEASNDVTNHELTAVDAAIRSHPSRRVGSRAGADPMTARDAGYSDRRARAQDGFGSCAHACAIYSPRRKRRFDYVLQYANPAQHWPEDTAGALTFQESPPQVAASAWMKASISLLLSPGQQDRVERAAHVDRSDHGKYRTRRFEFSVAAAHTERTHLDHNQLVRSMCAPTRQVGVSSNET
jgi:hypothetical protein